MPQTTSFQLPPEASPRKVNAVGVTEASPMASMAAIPMHPALAVRTSPLQVDTADAPTGSPGVSCASAGVNVQSEPQNRIKLVDVSALKLDELRAKRKDALAREDVSAAESLSREIEVLEAGRKRFSDSALVHSCDQSSLQRKLHNEKRKVDEQRKAVETERRALVNRAKVLADTKRRLLSRLEQEQKCVYDLVSQVSEVAQQPIDVERQINKVAPGGQRLRDDASVLCESGNDRPVLLQWDAAIEVEPPRRGIHEEPVALQWGAPLPGDYDLEAGNLRKEHMEPEPSVLLQWPSLSELETAASSSASVQSKDLEPGDKEEIEVSSPTALRHSVVSEFNSPSSPATPLVLTRGLAWQLLGELKHVTDHHSSSSAVIEQFGLGKGTSAWIQVEQAMQPHLDEDVRLRQQWMEFVRA